MNIENDTLQRMRSRLIAWFDGAQRDLPWRRSRDPYAIWISEVMLQQTRVETVVAYFERWMTRFATIEELANADIHDVLVVWQGLGYYSRARNLHAAARQLVEHHGGRMPADPAAIAQLRGVGRYTAGAIASIAFDLEEPLVDGNVARVFSRLFEIDLDPKSVAAGRRYWSLATQWVRGERPGDLNQALMELGATVCTPRSARCDRCPLSDDCRALALGRIEQLPPRAKKTAPRDETWAAVLARDEAGRLWVARRVASGLLGGLWEAPMVPISSASAASAARAVQERLGATRVAVREPFVHVFSHIRMTVVPVVAEGARGPFEKFDGYEQIAWVDDLGLEALPLSRLMRKVLAAAG